MSRTTRRHEAHGKASRRGPKNRDELTQRRLKSYKQTRPNERAKLRKEYR